MQKLLITILLIALSIASGVAGAWYFNRFHGNGYRIYTVDVKAIVAQKKKELLDRYKKIHQEETAAKIEKELGEFLVALDGKLTAYDTKGSIVILKDAVMGGETVDITKEIGTQVGVDLAKP